MLDGSQPDILAIALSVAPVPMLLADLVSGAAHVRSNVHAKFTCPPTTPTKVTGNITPRLSEPWSVGNPE